MRTKLTVALAAFALLALPPFAFSQSKEEAKKPGGLAGQDRKYFTSLAEANLAEVEAGKLAENKAQSDEVKKFARDMVEDHGKMLEEQQQMAKTKGVQLPKTPNRAHRAAMKKLEAASGGQFDRAYMSAMVKEHEKALKLAQDAAKNAKDPDIKATAEKAAPEIEKHLQLARQIADAKGKGKSNDKDKDKESRSK